MYDYRPPPSRDRAVTFGPVDALNPGSGYQIRIEDSTTGETLLFTSNHPITGKLLMTPQLCCEVASMYCGV